MKDRSKPRYIYFMRPVGMDGPIKIGCSYRPASRLIALAVWSPFPLEIIAVAPGDFGTERALHERFAAELFHNEWFHASPRLKAVCAALKQNVPLESALRLADEPNEAAA